MARWPWELFATQAMTITPIGNDKAAPCHVRAGSSQTQNASNAYRTAMTLLLQSHVFAVELKQGIWDFAVEIRSLNEAGLTNNDLRRLLIPTL